MSNQKSVQLTKKNVVKIIAAGPNIDLDKEIYAINWFDLKRPKLYDFYNQLAYPHLTRVNGMVHFKGIVTERIKGPPDNERQMLLIVSYPSAEKFLSMISNRMFLLTSVLRIKAVDYFTFGFTKRMDSGPKPLKEPSSYKDGSSYLLYHFETRDLSSKLLYELGELLDNMGLKVHFMGYKAALVGRVSDHKPLRTQPFLMDGLVLVENEDEKKLKQLAEDKAIQSLIKNNISNSFCLVRRML